MKSVKFLNELPGKEQRDFFESFDTFIFDLDGVVWSNYVPFPGAVDCLNNLKKLGKNVHYATNNSIKTCQNILDPLKNSGINADLSDIVNPLKTMIFLLEKSNITDPMYILASKTSKEELQKHGFKILPETSHKGLEQISDVLSHHDHAKEQKVGAVLIDIDFNIDYLKLQKAFWYLKYNSNCLFLVTSMDKTAPVGPKGPILIMYNFVESVRELLKVDNVNRSDFIQIGKPSQVMVDYIKKTYNILQSNKVLFVGDSIESDMATAAKGDFQKLLVFSGTEKRDSLDNWRYPDEYKPDYVVENLGVLNDILRSLYD